MEQIPAIIWTTDTELRVTSVLGTALSRLDRAPSEYIGKTFYALSETQDRNFPPIAAHLRALGGEPAKYGRAVGNRLFAARIEPLRDTHGRIVGCLGLALDVTERKRAEAISRQTSFAQGEGLPGATWASGHVMWHADTAADTSFPRLQVAFSEGLRAALGVPILLSGQVIAMLEFFSCQAREPDRDTLDMLQALGSQIGQFIERRRAEAEFTLLYWISTRNGTSSAASPWCGAHLDAAVAQTRTGAQQWKKRSEPAHTRYNLGGHSRRWYGRSREYCR